MSESRVLRRRLVGFGFLPVVAALSPLAAFPIIARVASVEEWSALAIGQAVGLIGSLVVSNGWSVVGPAIVARSVESERPGIAARSTAGRLILFAVVAPVLAGVAYVIAPTGSQWLAGAMAVAAAGGGFSLAWFAIGSGRFATMAALDTVPRVMGNLCGAAAAALTGELAYYPASVLTFQACAVGIVLRDAGTAGAPRLPFGAAWTDLRGNLPAALTEVVGGAYSMGAPAILALVASPVAVAAFSSGHRVTVWASIAITAVSSALQGWVAEGPDRDFWKRARVSGWIHLTVGIIGGAFLAVLGQPVTALLFGDRLAAPSSAMAFFGAFFFFWSLETVIGRHILAGLGRIGILFWTNAVGSTLGVALILVLGAVEPDFGASLALSTAIAAIVVSQFVCSAVLLMRGAGSKASTSSGDPRPAIEIESTPEL